MAITTSGNISIKGAAGNANSIEYEIEGALSGNASLATLSQASVEYTGSTRGNTPRDTNSSPYGMLEFSGYAHTWSTTGTVDEVVIGKTTRWDLNLVDSTPDNVGGTLDEVLTWPGGTGLRLQWVSLNTGWTSVKLGATEGSATTLARSAMTADGNTHYIADGNTYITNTDNASMYFELIA